MSQGTDVVEIGIPPTTRAAQRQLCGGMDNMYENLTERRLRRLMADMKVNWKEEEAPEDKARSRRKRRETCRGNWMALYRAGKLEDEEDWPE